MTLVRRSSPLGKAEAVKPRQIRITPTTHEVTTGSNGKKGLAAGEITNQTARAGV